MDDTNLLTGHKHFAPEKMKLIVLSEAPSNPLRAPSRSKVALRVTEDITWVRELNAAITYLHGGRILKQESIHNDYWGFMTAANDLFSAFDYRRKTYGVTAESSLEITIRMALVDIPTLGFAGTGYAGRSMFTPVGNPVWLAQGIQDDADFFSVPWEDKVKLAPITHTVADVWSSRRDDDENAASLARYRMTADRDERILGTIRGLYDDTDE